MIITINMLDVDLIIAMVIQVTVLLVLVLKQVSNIIYIKKLTYYVLHSLEIIIDYRLGYEAQAPRSVQGNRGGKGIPLL